MTPHIEGFHVVTPEEALQARRELSWFTTSSGRKFYPWRPEPAKINLVDIAHTLSQINRWGGHTRYPYSVAQHSVNVSHYLEFHYSMVACGKKAAWGLLHDATEAYMGGDIVSPIKHYIPDLAALESGIADAISTRFGLPRSCLEDPDVKTADLAVLAWEYRDLMPLTIDDEHGYASIPDPMAAFLNRTWEATIVPWPAEKAESEFLRCADRLGLKEALS